MQDCRGRKKSREGRIQAESNLVVNRQQNLLRKNNPVFSVKTPNPRLHCSDHGTLLHLRDGGGTRKPLPRLPAGEIVSVGEG